MRDRLLPLTQRRREGKRDTEDVWREKIRGRQKEDRGIKGGAELWKARKKSKDGD